MKTFCVCAVFLLIFIDISNGKQFFCLENPSNTYYYSGSVCTLSGISIEDASIEIKYQQKSYLTRMNIIESTLDDFPNNMFYGLSNINILSCIKCGLPDISKHSFSGLSNLVTLNISFGSFEVLQKNLFSQTPQLQYINASNGIVKDINDNAFTGLNKLKILDLSTNKIKKITNKMFAPLDKLNTLRLSYNEIEILDEELFVNNLFLDYLYLDHNNIAIIDGDIFDSMCKPNIIVLSSNKLTSLNTTNLHAKYIFAANNTMTEVFIGDDIVHLYLNQNQIQNVECESNNSEITILGLSKNNLKGLGCIGSLKQLTYLDLSYNEVGDLRPNSFAMLTNLNTLKLKSSKISNLVYGVFSHQNNLQYLDISYNFLRNIPVNIFLAASDLKSLFIDGNNLTDFSYHDLKSAFKSLETIGLGDNNFNCTFLAEAIKFLNAQEVKTIVSSGDKVTTTHNINGIHCKETSVPAWIKPKKNATSNSTQPSNDDYNSEEIKSIIDQISILLKAKDATHDSILKISENIQINNNQVYDIKNDILRIKSEILKLELGQTNNMTNSSNTIIWTLVNQLNNITLEKQLLNNREQIQEINNIKFEIEKLSYKLNEMSTKLSTYISKGSSLGLADSNNSYNDVSTIKNINIVIITLVVIFCIYKLYIFLKRDVSKIRRYNTQNTVHSSLEMHDN